MASEQTVLVRETRRSLRRGILPKMAGVAVAISLFLLAVTTTAQTSPSNTIGGTQTNSAGAFCSGTLQVLGRTFKVDITATQFQNTDAGYGTMLVTSKLQRYKCLVAMITFDGADSTTAYVVGGFYRHGQPYYLIVKITAFTNPPGQGQVGFIVVNPQGFVVDGTGQDPAGDPVEMPFNGMVGVNNGESGTGIK